MSLLPVLARLVASRIQWVFATGDERDAEILALRHQVLVLQRQVARPALTDTDRTILAVLSSVFDIRRLREVLFIVQPATVIGWHRHLVARHWTQPSAPKPGRPPLAGEIRRLAIRIAGENPAWGYRRIHGELCRLGHKVAPSSVWKILRAAGINPAPGRTGPTWMEFIRNQAKGIVATDFCCVDTVNLRRLHVLFFIEIKTRRVHLAGITTNPAGDWTTQAARNFLMGVGREFRFVIHDGAGQYTRAFDAVFEATGATAITTPPRAPTANAYAERWVRTLRHEVLDRTIIWNERQLRALLTEYLHHYNQHRPHRSLQQRAPDDADVVTIVPGRTIERHATCGGLINEYRRLTTPVTPPRPHRTRSRRFLRGRARSQETHGTQEARSTSSRHVQGCDSQTRRAVGPPSDLPLRRWKRALAERRRGRSRLTPQRIAPDDWGGRRLGQARQAGLPALAPAQLCDCGAPTEGIGLVHGQRGARRGSGLKIAARRPIPRVD